MTTTSTTQWTCGINQIAGGPVASLTVSINGAPATGFNIKGMSYSPCPLNGSNNTAQPLGDWFWDSYAGPGYDITGWAALWARDLSNIRAMGVNALRIYSMMSRQLLANGDYPSPWNGGTLMTHTSFLDSCWNGGVNPLYVMVSIPLPMEMFWKPDYPPAPSELAFWPAVLAETVAQVAAHPAVMGFIFQNEQDSSVVTYGVNNPNAPFWWSQVEAMAATVKNAMSGNSKLVGMAVHDDPSIAGQAASFMAQCPSIDFWGVNSYQPQTFNPVFEQTNNGPGYAGLTGAALKPVILTEWGMPATTRDADGDPSTIKYTTASIQNAANVIQTMVPQAYSQEVNLGIFYFEYSDEWWNQDGAPNIYTWWGGPSAPGLPNGYWDQDGFGLYAIARGAANPPLSNNAPIWTQNGGTGGPALPIDALTPCPATIATLTSAYESIINIQANQPWSSTGIMITPNSSIKVAYMSGCWTADPQDNSGMMYDASGCSDVIVPANQPLYPMVNVRMGALVGRVNGGAPFLIGNGPTTMPVTASGLLELCINDDLTGAYGAGLKDNSGYITVQISSN